MTPKLMIRNWFVEIVAALLVLLFLYTAISKLRDFTGFARSMLHSSVIADYHVALAVTIPALELIVATLLIIPNLRRTGLLVSTLLMAAFTGYVGYVLITYSSNLPCTCGGIIEHMNWQQHLAFNIFFTIISLAAYFFYPKRFARTNRRSRTPVKIVGNHFDLTN